MAMTPSEFFRKLEQSLPELQRKGIIILEVETENFNNQNFENEGFLGDKGFEKWLPRKNKKDNKSPILVKSGDLKRAATTALPIDNGISFVFNKKYMELHNKGEGRLPKRQFIGRSAALDKILKKKWRKLITDHLKNL